MNTLADFSRPSGSQNALLVARPAAEEPGPTATGIDEYSEVSPVQEVRCLADELAASLAESYALRPAPPAQRDLHFV